MQPQGPYGAGGANPQPPAGYPPQPAPGQPVPGQLPAQPPAYPGAAPLPGQPPGPVYTPPPGLTGRPADNVMPPPPPRPESPYDFFMNPQKSNKSGKPAKLPGNKFVWIIGGAVLLLLIITVVSLATPKTVEKPALVAVAQAQQESLRLCTEGAKQVKLQPSKSFATNCQLSLTSEQRQLLAQMDRAGAKPDGGILGATRSSKADQQLTAAKSSSDYDNTFLTVMEGQLNTQLRTIKRAEAAPDTTGTERKLLQKLNQSTVLLQQQLKNSAG